jgi:dTDP-4-dehydrorhamnose 3,5-epimerase
VGVLANIFLMQIEKTPIKDLVILRPRVFADNRGFFLESYNKRTMTELGISSEFVQDNRSFSKRGTLRGMHLQVGDSAQAKLVTCLSGSVLDVAVDLRPKSATFGQHFSVVLDAAEKTQFFVPRGFAHGFIVLSETAEFFYKCDNFYNPKAEIGIMYNDPEMGINWRLNPSEFILSDKDKVNGSLANFIQAKYKL